MSHDTLDQREARFCSWGDTVHYNVPPKYFTSSDGAFLYDESGTPYLDVQMAYSSVNFGYRNAFFLERATYQLERLPQLASEYLTEAKVDLAEALCTTVETMTGTPGRVHFNVGGAQAIDDSLKLVAVNRGSRRAFAFEGSYHGRTIGASAITSSFRYRNNFGEFGSRAFFVPFPYCFRCPYGKRFDDCDYYCAKQFERLFETEYYSVLDARKRESEFVAFYIEPIQGTGGYVVPPPDYFRRIERVLDEYGVLLVDDEIQMGFFRTGAMWAGEHFGITPDIVVFGKSLTNGLNPISGLWAREALIGPTQWPPGSTHSTFGSNPLGLALGVATFEWIAARDYATSVAGKGAYLLHAMKQLQRHYPVMGDVDGLGLALRIEMCFPDGFTPDRALAQAMKNAGLQGDLDTPRGRAGLLLDIGGYFKNVFTLAPSLEVTYAELDLFIDLFEQLLRRHAPRGT
jgi:4-aminobutyrate aminotransferase-like enzyme